MPMDSKSFDRLIQLPEPVSEMFEAWDKEMPSRVDPDLEARLLCRETWTDAEKELEARLEEDPAHLRLLWEELRIACRRYPRWEAAGIPLEIYRDTMMFATRYLNDALRDWGDWRFTAGWWFPRQLAMELFRLGSLEFELAALPEGRKVSLHIPSDASLAPEAIDDSLARFRDFAARFYPDWENVDLYCDSWLISPVLRDLLPATSRILAFQDRFEVLSVDTESLGAVNWVFPGPRKDFALLPENTGLQRKMKAFLLAGGKPGWAEGRLKSFTP